MSLNGELFILFLVTLTYLIYLSTSFTFFNYRFDKVPLVTPNGDVLVNELNFEVEIISFTFFYTFRLLFAC